MKTAALSSRMAPFLERGLLTRVPTPWQVTQGTFEMIPYVIVPDAYDKHRYRGAPLGRPYMRLPLLMGYTLGGYLRFGSGLRSSEKMLQKHMLCVLHTGQPVYDLQLAQTFPNGLENMRRRFLRVRDPSTWYLRLERRFVGGIIPKWNEYCDEMMDHIDRAARFDYDGPPEWFRPEFWSLVGFTDYCATSFSERRRDDGSVFAAGGKLVSLLGTRFRNASP